MKLQNARDTGRVLGLAGWSRDAVITHMRIMGWSALTRRRVLTGWRATQGGR